METATETITITQYTITLTDADVAAILVDPAPFQKQLRALRADNGQRLQKRKSISLNGHKPKEQAPAATGKGAAGKGGFAKVACPQCKQPISKAQLSNHLAKKHAVSAAASPASD